jgi:hypothetical protein
VRRKVDYIIKASVDTVELRASDGPTMKGLCEIPRFTVKAGGVREAESLAKDIIDPLHMTDTHITAELAPRESWSHAMEEELGVALGALNGDSNDAEHEALLGIAEIVARYLGKDWNQLMYPDPKEEDE